MAVNEYVLEYVRPWSYEHDEAKVRAARKQQPKAMTMMNRPAAGTIP